MEHYCWQYEFAILSSILVLPRLCPKLSCAMRSIPAGNITLYIGCRNTKQQSHPLISASGTKNGVPSNHLQLANGLGIHIIILTQPALLPITQPLQRSSCSGGSCSFGARTQGIPFNSLWYSSVGTGHVGNECSSTSCTVIH